MPRWQVIASKIAEGFLYLLVILMPITGWLMSSAANFPVSIFGLFTLPDLVEPSESLMEILRNAHEKQSIALMTLTAIHAAKDLFEPRSTDFSNGFARQAVLKSASDASMPFHVVFIPGAGSNVVYMLEREVQVDDVAAHWSSSDKPWEQWQAIVGSPPADQVVGITGELDEVEVG